MKDKSAEESMNEIVNSLKEKLSKYKEQAAKDLEIDEIDIDTSVLSTPKLMVKYNDAFTDESLSLKDFYSFRRKIELERWRYWSGKQSDQYYAKNGVVHEKILKGDIEKYLKADEKLALVDEIISIQKAIADYLERCIKEIQSRNFHIRACIDWRRFTSGG